MVMGWIWTGMVLLALGAAVLTGQTGALTAAALEGAASAIRLALGLAGALLHPAHGGRTSMPPCSRAGWTVCACSFPSFRPLSCC